MSLAFIVQTGLEAKRTLDVGIILSILQDEQLLDEISEDGINSFVPDVINEYWVLLTDDDVIGLYRLHALNFITYQIHAFILPQYRKKYAKQSGHLILDWCLDMVEFNKLIAEIPVKYENVYRFTKSMGFKDEGVNRQSFRKDDKIWDTYRLGITRQEIENG